MGGDRRALEACGATALAVKQRDPSRRYVRKPGGGRKPKDPRLVFEASVYVLRTGCQWKALP